MTFTPIPHGTLNWDVPLNAALTDLDNRISSLAVNVTDPTYGAVGDGTTDNGPALQAALDAVNASGGGEIYVPPGTYLLSSGLPLRIHANTTLTLSPATTLRRGMNSDSILVNGLTGQALGGYTGQSNITVRGGTWDANGVAFPTYCTGLSFGHCSDISVHDTTILDIPGYHAIELNSTSGGRVRNCRLFGLQQAGDRTFTEAIQIDTATTGTFPWFGPYDDTPCTDIEISGCTIGASGTVGTTAWTRGVGSHTAVIGVWHTDVRILGNQFTSLLGYAVRAFSYNNLIISNNTVVGCDAGFQVRTADSATQGFTQVARNCVIEGNILQNITGAVNASIVVQGETGGEMVGVTVSDNTVDTNTADSGIYFLFCQQFACTNNTTVDVGQYGIRADDCEGGSITGNRDFSPTLSSFFSSVSSHIEWVSNLSDQAQQNGFLTQGGSNVSIEHNQITAPGRQAGTRYGIRCSTSADQVRVVGNKVRPMGSGNEATYALSFSSSVTNVVRWGNDLVGSTWVTGELEDATTTPSVRWSRPHSSKISTTTVSATTTETVVDTLAIPAGNAAGGTVYRLVVMGTADNPSDASPGTLTLRARLGGVAGTILATTVVQTPTSTAQSNKGWIATADLINITSGVTGTWRGGMTVVDEISTAFPSATFNAPAAAITVSSIAAQDFVITVQWSEATAGYVIRADSGYGIRIA